MRRSNASALVSFAVALAVWIVLAVLLRSDKLTLVPAPWDVAVAFAGLARTRLANDIIVSIREALGGWLIGSIIGIIFGLLIGRITVLRQTLAPAVEILRSVSPLVWVPLAIVWFGIGYTSKAFIVALIAFFTVIVNTIDGASEVSPEHLRVASMLRFSRWDVLRRVVLMSALPDILIGLQYALTTAWGGVIIAELTAGNEGIGGLEISQQQSFNVAGVIVGMITIAMLGYLANVAFVALTRRLFPWMPSARQRART
ncbi:MAG: hypothetical protein NVS2B17_34390 [Candidatus Velthaea sp.]